MPDTPTSQRHDPDTNPGQKHEDDLTHLYDNRGNIRTLDEGIASREGAAAQARARLRASENGAQAPAQKPSGALAAVRNRENANPWRTSWNKNNLSNAGAKIALNYAKKRWLAGGLVGFLFTIIASMGGLTSIEIAHLNQMFNDKAWGLQNKPMSHRMAKQKQARYFTNPNDCVGAKIKCRFHRGVSDNEIKKLRDAGLRPDVAEANGKKYIRSFRVTDTSGKIVTVTADNFMDEIQRNPNLTVTLNNVAKPKSILTMGAATLRKVVQFRLNLTNPLGDGTDQKELEREMRKTLYSEKNTNGKFSISEEQDKAIKEAAENALPENFDQPVTPTLSLGDIDLSEVHAADIVQQAAGGGVKATIMGVAAVPDKVCSAYDILRRLVVLAKIYKARALIKYANLFMTIGAKLKAGSAKAQEIALLLNIAMSLGTTKTSLNKNFFHSDGWFYVSQGAITNPASLARFTNGGAWIGGLQTVRDTIEKLASSVGINLKRDCGAIKSIWGQLILGAIGIALSIGTFGTAQVLGIVGSAALSTTIAVLSDFAIPMLAAYANGTVAPDPKDPEGGFGMGNALGAGMMAFSSEVGRANGMRPMKTSEYSRAIAEARDYENQILAAERRAQSPFDADNPYSLVNKVRYALMPYTSSATYTAQQAFVAALTPFTMLQQAFLPGFLASPAYAANEDPYGTQYCTDEDIVALKLAASPTCDILYYEDSRTILSNQYTPDAVSAYMVDNRHVDPETGQATSDEYKNYLADCVNDQTPILEDGGGISIEENKNSNGGTINTKQCYDESEKYTMFRMFQMDSAILVGNDQGANGTFGKETTIPEL